MKKCIFCAALIWLVGGSDTQAQVKEKVWFDGLARSFFARDAVGPHEYGDSLSAQNVSNGYNLLDLNTHINPIEDFEVFAQLRIRNTFGGFFGSGTSVDVRQLRASGVINEKVRFSIGDLFLEQSRFTLHNWDEEMSWGQEDMDNAYRDIRVYENFYVDNRWRLQGLQTDFSFAFDRFIRTLEFDGFITRPRGSSLISGSLYSSDLLLGGGTVRSVINPSLSWEANYINLFEIPTSGTTNISLRNPVFHTALWGKKKKGNILVEPKIEAGFSGRHWVYTDLAGDIQDSTSVKTQGMFFEFQTGVIRQDSSFMIEVGYRYVDANFRSAGTQSRRIDFGSGSAPTVFPTYTNDMLPRPITIFDLMTDENIYNQELSATLMTFNPAFSNVLPFGDATPNRQGGYFKAKAGTSKQVLNGQLEGGYFQEVIGQGTPNKRTFVLAKAALHANLSNSFLWKRKAQVSLVSQSESTQRASEDIDQVTLFSHQLSAQANLEVVPKLSCQFAFRWLQVTGNEFYTVRDSQGEIINFMLTDFDQQSQVLSAGLLYQLSDKVYANLQFNGWGASFDDELYPTFNYRRLLFVISAQL